MAQLGSWSAGFLILYLISVLVLLAFRDKKYTYQAVTIASAISFGIAFLLGSYGSFTDYFVPWIAVSVVLLIRVKLKLNKLNSE